MTQDQFINHKRRSDSVNHYATLISILVGLTVLWVFGKSAMSQPIRDREMLMRHEKTLYDVIPEVQAHSVAVARFEEQGKAIFNRLDSIDQKLDRLAR